jgi:hypothetical protein
MKIVYGFAVLLIAAIIWTGSPRFSAADSGGSPKPALIHLKQGEKRVSRQRQAAILLKVDPVSTGSNHFVVASEDLDPGERINVHRHEMEVEVLILYKGIATVTLGDPFVRLRTFSFGNGHSWPAAAP